MNREILFRAKKVDGGEWVEGYVVQRYDAWFIYDINNSDTCRQNNYLIDENTICQYTGLTDKNGKKIYENDIVQIGCYKGIVEYEYGSFVIKWSNAKFLRNDIGYWTRLNGFYIVGNVYDNPELLEECNE
jgi:uncharacterized phage protein (TIGR01671 family)